MVTKNSAAYWLGSSSDVSEMLMIDFSRDFILFIPHIWVFPKIGVPPKHPQNDHF